jgi:hypothetical protein
MSDKIPHDCPICGLMLRDMNDVLSYEEYECCTDCQDQFVYRDRIAWIGGARPSKEQVQEFRDKLRNRASYLMAKL